MTASIREVTNITTDNSCFNPSGSIKINTENIKYSFLSCKANLHSISAPYDNILCIDIIERMNEGLEEDGMFQPVKFKTGIVLYPPKGFHFEIHHTDQLTNQGYINLTPLIIDSNNPSEIIVTIMKIKEKDDIEFGGVYFQIILRRSEYSRWEKIDFYKEDKKKNKKTKKSKKKKISSSSSSSEDEEYIPKKISINNIGSTKSKIISDFGMS